MADRQANEVALDDPTHEEGSLVPVVKVTTIGRDGTEESNVVQTPEDVTGMFKAAGAILPPLDPRSLSDLYEMSGALRTNVDAYVTNVDAFGHTFEPVFDVDDDDAVEKVREALVEAALSAFETDNPDSDVDPKLVDEVTDEVVAAKVDEIRRQMMRERMFLDTFFDSATVDESFTALRAKTRVDTEVTGNGYWEVLRNNGGEIVQFVYVPGHTIRLMPREQEPQEVQMPIRRTFLDVGVETVRRKFRRYVQVVNNLQLVWFKEYGDPRVYSSKTGNVFRNEADLERVEQGVRPATELMHFKLHNPRTPYGVPRWISELTSVLGTRHAQEVNLLYFENRSIPPMVIMVSGGRLNQSCADTLRSHIENEIKGKRNWHKIMILEAESATPGPWNNGRVRIEIKPLTGTQLNDAQFLQYIEKNTDMIGSVFRLPRLLRGDVRDFNRATAQTALEFTEQQVFQPLRKEFDFVVNRMILSELGVQFWKFRSKGPEFADPVDRIKAINETAKAAYLTPGELRELASEVFDVEFKQIDADWTEQPMPLSLAGIPVEDKDGIGDEEDLEEELAMRSGGRMATQAARLLALRDVFQARAYDRARREYFAQHVGLDVVEGEG